MLRVKRLPALASVFFCTNLKLVQTDQRNTQSGYSLVSVLVTLIVISVLLVVFLQRMTPVLNEATKINLKYTANSLDVSAQHVRQRWRISGQGDRVRVAMTGQAQGREIWVNSYGWPIDSKPTQDKQNLSTPQCVRIWEALLEGKDTKVVADKVSDRNIFLAIATVDGCRYEYWSPSSKRVALATIDYRPNQDSSSSLVQIHFND